MFILNLARADQALIDFCSLFDCKFSNFVFLSLKFSGTKNSFLKLSLKLNVSRTQFESQCIWPSQRIVGRYEELRR